MSLLNFKFLQRLGTPAPVNSALALNDRIDDALNKLQGQVNFLKPIGKLTAPAAAIANTETVVATSSIPANTLQAGDVIRFAAVGVWNQTIGLTGTAVARLRIGTTTLTGQIVAAHSFASTSATRTNQLIVVEGMAVIVTNGAGGTARGQAHQRRDYLPTGTPIAGVTANVAVNTTVANLCQLTFISGAATHNATFATALIELLR